MLVFGLVVLGLALRGMSSEERVRFGKTILAGLRFIRNSITKPPSGGESFYAALKARTKWAFVTPSIVGAYAVVFLLLVIGSGDLSDPRTLVDGGGNIGVRTTNGEWWRLFTAMFVHDGLLHLIAAIAGIAQVGLLVERLVGRLAFAVVYVASGVLVGIWHLNLHPVSVHAGAAGATFGVYGLLLASLLLGVAQRSTLTVPVPVLKGLWPGATLFVAYNMLTDGMVSDAMQAGLVVGFIGGLLIAVRVISDKPPVRRVLAVSAATAAIVVVLAAPLRGLSDVSSEVARFAATEERTSRSYDQAVDRFKRGRASAQELATIADAILSELQALHAGLGSLDNVPPEHLPMLNKASEYLASRQASWRLRAEGLRAGRPQTLQQADAAEQLAKAALASAVEYTQR
ncbi:MAG TPA: rhomboid family intramembrane serine protease [Vicinamibacterales bacterium]|jgi:membrane associated rhomboid family serine protease|nr:rhomboid family intramembrane serine protease [Vicinamibacterales bacterium]